MTENVLMRLFEHNDWANRQIVRACSTLTEEQLDAPPRSGRGWSIRRNLVHLVAAQEDYLLLLTMPGEPRGDVTPPIDELERSADESGAGLWALARAENGSPSAPLLDDGYRIEPWVVLVQALNHATEHRKQIAGLLRELGVDPPRLDGWAFGEAMGALTQIEA